MGFRVIAPEGLPLERHAEYAQRGIVEAQEREAARAAANAERRAKEQALKDYHSQVAAENKLRDEKKARAQAERDAKAFDDSLRHAFFEGNPSASESDWLRNSKAIRDEALRQRTLAGFEGRESLVQRNVEILRRRGGFSGL